MSTNYIPLHELPAEIAKRDAAEPVQSAETKEMIRRLAVARYMNRGWAHGMQP
jgi:hypothetical protein